MTDLSQTIAPRSDQLNADDLIGQSRTIKITRVSRMSEEDQPIAIHFEGDGGKPYKPCKSMRRVLVTVWGVDGNSYVGRSMTIYRDDKVVFGGMAVGGIRISHMSGLDRDVTMALTVTRASRKPYTVKPLANERPPTSGGPAASPRRGRDALFDAAREKARAGTETFTAWHARLTAQQAAALEEIEGELQDLRGEADDRPDDDDGFPGDQADAA